MLHSQGVSCNRENFQIKLLFQLIAVKCETRAAEVDVRMLWSPLGSDPDIFYSEPEKIQKSKQKVTTNEKGRN